MLLVLYAILALVPLNDLVMYSTSFPQCVKVTHFSWFLSVCLPSSFSLFVILPELVIYMVVVLY